MCGKKWQIEYILDGIVTAKKKPLIFNLLNIYTPSQKGEKPINIQQKCACDDVVVRERTLIFWIRKLLAFFVVNYYVGVKYNMRTIHKKGKKETFCCVWCISLWICVRSVAFLLCKEIFSMGLLRLCSRDELCLLIFYLSILWCHFARRVSDKYIQE